MQGLGFIDSTW